MITITFKSQSIKAEQICLEIFAAIPIAAQVWETYGATELIVTSLRDGEHRQNSLHYEGKAADLRTKNLPSVSAKRNARDLLAGQLGGDYDVLLEDLSGPNEHLHLEWDPKR